MKIGITGHQKLGKNESWQWVEDIMRQKLAGVRPLIGLTSLAVGADQRFANIVVAQGGELHVILPFVDYERTFKKQALVEYRNLLLRAKTVETLKGGSTDEESYLAAGKRMVDLAELIIAVWNGLPAKGKGGTADIVEQVKLMRKPLIHINPQDCTLTQTGD